MLLDRSPVYGAETRWHVVIFLEVLDIYWAVFDRTEVRDVAELLAVEFGWDFELLWRSSLGRALYEVVLDRQGVM